MTGLAGPAVHIRCCRTQPLRGLRIEYFIPDSQSMAVGTAGDISTGSSPETQFIFTTNHQSPLDSSSQWATNLRNISLLYPTHVHRKRGLEFIGEELFARYGKHCWSLSSCSKPPYLSWCSPGEAMPMLLASVLTENHCSTVRAWCSSSCLGGSQCRAAPADAVLEHEVRVFTDGHNTRTIYQGLSEETDKAWGRLYNRELWRFFFSRMTGRLIQR